jgi:hypothetical protein
MAVWTPTCGFTEGVPIPVNDLAVSTVIAQIHASEATYCHAECDQGVERTLS